MPEPTPFHPRTEPLCVSMQWKDWAGWAAVRSYDTPVEREYHAVRQACGVLDVTPLFKYEVRGAGAGELLARITSRDPRRISRGVVAYVCWCDEAGKVIDDGTVTRLEEDRYRVTTASPFLRHLREAARGLETAGVSDETEALGALAVQGPRAREVLHDAGAAEAGPLGFFRWTRAKIAGTPVEITRTGYTGDLGYEVWIPRDRGLAVWDRLLEAGRPHRLLPFGLDTLDILRIEAGFILQGVDYHSAPHAAIETRKSSPYELGLGWTVKLDRPPFRGRDALRREKERGSPWALVGLEGSWDDLERLYDTHGLPPDLPVQAQREPVPVYLGSDQIGQATSRTWSPMLKKYIALATVARAHANPGTRLELEHTVEYRRERVEALVRPLPFFDPPRKKS